MVKPFPPRPFFVIATQTPTELEGTFPLPEAQLDRFLLHIHLGYPERDEEKTIMERFQKDDPLLALKPAVKPEQIALLNGRHALALLAILVLVVVSGARFLISYSGKGITCVSGPDRRRAFPRRRLNAVEDC